jgi:integrase
MGYTFARIGAAVAMKVEDYYVQKRRGWVRLHEKGGKVTEMPCNHNLERCLDEWINASGLSSEPTAPLFPTMRHGELTAPTRPVATQCVHDDSTKGLVCRYPHQDQCPQFPGDRYHHLPAERRKA